MRSATGMRRGTLVLAVVAVGALTLSACSSGSGTSKSGKKTLLVGAMAPTSGAAASIGVDQIKGAQLAVKSINASNELPGYTLELKTADNGGVPQQGVKAMNTLVNVDHVPTVISGFGSVLLAAQPIAARSKSLLFNIAGSSNQLLGKDYLYNLTPLPALMAPPIAGYFISKGYTKVGELFSDDAYGHDISSAFNHKLKSKGGTVASSQSYSIGSTDLTNQLTALKNAGVQAVLAVALGETAKLVVKQAQSIGLNVPFGFFGIGSAVDTGEVSTTFPTPYVETQAYIDAAGKTSLGQKFLADWKKSGQNHKPSNGINQGYEGVEAFAATAAAAIKKGRDPSKGADLQKTLDEVKSFPNYIGGGKIGVTSNHDAVENVELDSINGKTVKMIAELSGRQAASGDLPAGD